MTFLHIYMTVHPIIPFTESDELDSVFTKLFYLVHTGTAPGVSWFYHEISVRGRDNGDIGSIGVKQLIERLKAEVRV